jgi:hypothetical protein
MEAGTIYETDETGENAVAEKIEFLTGLTGLPPFPYVPSRVASEHGAQPTSQGTLA